MELFNFQPISGSIGTSNPNGTKTLHLSKPFFPVLPHNNPKPLRIQLPIKKKQQQEQQQQQPKKPKKKCSIATDFLRLMDTLQLPVNADIYACLLKECTDSRDPEEGPQVHAHIARAGIRPCIHLANRLLLMYAACGCLTNAHKLFDEMPVRDPISWAIIIMVNIENNRQKQALKLFEQMQLDGIRPSVLILVHVLKVCCSVGAFELGKQVHGWALKMGMVMGSSDLFLGSSLVDFYGKFDCLESARRVFDQMQRRDTVLWTSMIVGYGREERFEEAFEVFKEMGRAGKRKNSFTFSGVLRACGRMDDDGLRGKQIHANAIKVGVESNLFVGSSLINMYGKCRLLRDARQVFEVMRERNIVCWNAMLNAYAQRGCCIEAVKFLYDMKAAGVEPQESMLNEVRVACGSSNVPRNRDLAENVCLPNCDHELGCVWKL